MPCTWYTSLKASTPTFQLHSQSMLMSSTRWYCAAEVVGIEVLGQRPEEFAQRLGVGVHVDEHPSVPRVARQIGETDAFGRVALREVVGVGRPCDAPVEPVRPQVVRALQLRCVPAARFA